MIEQGNIQQCTIDRNDVYAAEDIFGPVEGILKVKPTGQKTDHVENSSNVILPSDIIGKARLMRSMKTPTNLEQMEPFPLDQPENSQGGHFIYLV